MDFLVEKSTMTNWLMCDKKRSNCMISVSLHDLIIIDLARAFDKVSHHFLLKNSEKCEFKKKCCSRSRTFLVIGRNSSSALAAL